MSPPPDARPPKLEPIFAAVLAGDAELGRVLCDVPDAYRTPMREDVLIEAIPHWLYVGDIPLHLAAAALKPKTVELLLQYGSDPNAKNRRGAGPLHYACDARPNSGRSWDPAAQVSIIALLVERGAALDSGDHAGSTPLHRAVRARSVSAVRKLLELGARTDCRLRPRGSTPLHLAAQSTGASGTAGTLDAQLEIIALFRQFSADFAALDNERRSPHDWATLARVREALATA
ncbi:MAG TPA: ankyrin repeat domain-containing protein [Polyangiaceae bacterium]|nr:ankyrin repeat domain-containing protein [Polyangiaceae bacterium]